MALWPVRGQMEAVAWRDGSSGRFTGDLCGLYEGHRDGNPAVQPGELRLAHGHLGLVVVHDASAVLPDRDAVHPLAGGRRLEDLDRAVRGDDGTLVPFPLSRHSSVRLRVEPEASGGIYAGARGEIVLDVPHHKDAGRLTVQTEDGDLHMTFLEWTDNGRLVADLTPDGQASTGVFAGASGNLHFALDIFMVGVGRGPYWGELVLGSAGSAWTHEQTG